MTISRENIFVVVCSGTTSHARMKTDTLVDFLTKCMKRESYVKGEEELDDQELDDNDDEDKKKETKRKR